MKKQYRPMIILFLAPVTLLYLTLFIYPAGRAFYISLFDWSGFGAGMRYIGLNNYVEMMSDRTIWEVAMPNTLMIIFAGGVLVFGISFLLSGVLTTKMRGKKILRAVLFFPSVLSPVAVAVLWGFIYNRQWGLLNSILGAVGLGFLERTWSAPETLFWALLVAYVWMTTGLYCVILVAGLDRVPTTLLEAAEIEGAGELRKFFSIKLPLIRDIVTTAVILWCISAVKEFALFFAWGGGIDVPPEGAQNLAVRMYITAFGKRTLIYRMGYATTIGVLMFVLIGVIVLCVYMANRRRDTIEY